MSTKKTQSKQASGSNVIDAPSSVMTLEQTMAVSLKVNMPKNQIHSLWDYTKTIYVLYLYEFTFDMNQKNERTNMGCLWFELIMLCWQNEHIRVGVKLQPGYY